ncbi:uncharacterized protein PRCAT00003916001 [Priceomyces carsonii]|uniref:uncharacterized protein n=1 Tax=Priceomyces carsonii TaxID=28549 RepID=UPI002EDB04BD|nr:unnamed protein product [Priceomyces carsonii]
MLIGTEHQKESTKFNVEKSREPVSKDLNHYIKQSRLHKPTDVVEDCHFETSPLLEPHDRESNEQLTGNLNSTPPLSQDLK